MKYLFPLSFFFLIFLLSACNKADPGFVKVKNTGFELNGKPYYYLGTNFWYGLNLGSKGSGGNRERLVRELDRLKALGVTNLRVMGGSEGPDTEPYRMLPSLQPKPGEYNQDVLDGLDFLLSEMKKRDMYAIVCLNNFWNWSGGMAQYLVWSGVADSIPYPPPHPGGDWDRYQDFTGQFYINQKAMDMFNKHIEFIVNRKNAYSNVDYKNDPTIMAWELANEPRGNKHIEAFLKWVDSTAGLIKKLDPNHLVTTGSEGATSSPFAGTDLAKDHSSPHIDYTTIHIWVQNWGIYNPAKADSTYEPAVKYALNYLEEHEKVARKINKPMVLEEFGISRDLNNHDPASATTIRDKYYTRIFEAVYQKANQANSVVAGCNFWAWAGEGRPRQAEGLWKMHDDFIGDPPHEAQGWYSVYEKDSSTNVILKEYAQKMDGIGKNK
ncbi:MAG: cellulase family glycosylhydrolase [Bacteroidota bacterium]